jgi:hypothetical protein
MGRYYSGDIEGKFMFAVQSSTAADRFGSTWSEPGYVEYYFEKNNLEQINEELSELKSNYDVVKNFFDKREKNGSISYSNDALEEANISNEMMSDYADYILGEKIRKQVEEFGECNFTAEL